LQGAIIKLESSLLKIKSSKFVGSRQFVEIDNATYYIDALSGYKRDEAKMTCESMNMTMISFEGDEQKWRSVNRWLADSGFAKKYSNRTCIYAYFILKQFIPTTTFGLTL
jgi:hypothetical protein